MRGHRWARGAVTVGAGAALVIGTPAGGYPRPGHVERVSLASNGHEANGQSGYDPTPTGTAYGVVMTPDARYIAFVSNASNLVPGASGSHDEVYVRDLHTGRTRIASIANDGSFGVGAPKTAGAPVDCAGASYPAISADGRYVAFSSCYVNLVGAGHDLNNAEDIFVHDMRSGTTRMVSVSTAGKQQHGDAWQTSMSADGRYIAFSSDDAATLDGPACQNALAQVDAVAPLGLADLLQCDFQVYVHDMKTGRTWRASATKSGAPGDSSSYAPSISPDGRYVAFTSNATNLAPNDTNRCLPTSVASCPDVYLHDVRTGANELISVALDGQAPSGPGTGGPATGMSGGGESGAAFYPTTISADDRYVVFGSNADNLVPSTPFGLHGGIYVRDRLTARTERVSVDSTGQPLASGGFATYAGISANGRDIVIANSCAVHDLVTGATTVLPVCAKNPIVAPQLSADGRYVAFASGASDLVAGDHNKSDDVFLLDQGSPLGAARLSSARLAGSAAAAGPALVAASVTARPSLGDLFVRLDVADLPRLGAADPGVVFGLDFAVAGHDYELRIGAVAGAPTFGLFGRSAGGWIELAKLRGGYGTTGESVVAALPLADLSLADGRAPLTNVTAFAAVGTYFTGSNTILDRLALTNPN